MPVYTDQTGRTLTLNTPPQRIISLVPSQTELLADLGLDEQVIGITKFCVHPEKWFHRKHLVGGTKQIKQEIIRQLEPDLVIANKEENVREQIVELEKDFPVWVSDISTLSEAFEMMEQIGIITNRQKESNDIVARIKESFLQLPTANRQLQTAYLIWQKPYMTVGRDTFIHAMMEAAGFDNIFKTSTRYPEIRIEDLANAGCELLLLSSEPFPFKQKHADELQALLPDVKILLVDGEMFSWYGSRLMYAAEYFAGLRGFIS